MTALAICLFPFLVLVGTMLFAGKIFLKAWICFYCIICKTVQFLGHACFFVCYRARDAEWAVVCVTSLLVLLVLCVCYSQMWRHKDNVRWYERGYSDLHHDDLFIPAKQKSIGGKIHFLHN